MKSHVIATGVRIRLASETESEAAERARRGGDFELNPDRSFQYQQSEPVLEDDAVWTSPGYPDSVRLTGSSS